MRTEKRRLLVVLFILSVSFVALIIYLNLFLLFKGEAYLKLSYNRRNLALEQSVKRGRIEDRNGVVIADTLEAKNGFQRDYKYPKTYSHIVGYNSLDYGKAGLEQTYNLMLLGFSGNFAVDEVKKITGINQGYDLRLSIDHELQTFAREKLLRGKGAILSMDLKNGDLLCMASYPDFDPAKVAESWKELTERKDFPLVNRASSGLYPPGSIFKIISANALLSHIDPDEIYRSNGEEKVGGYVFHDSKKGGYGDINLKDAFKFSSNTYFARMSTRLTESDWQESVNEFELNDPPDFDIYAKKLDVNFKDLSEVEVAAAAIGQGKLLVTPLSMLEMVSIVANDGVFIRPRLVKKIISPKGREMETALKRGITSISKRNCLAIKEMMRESVKSGTGKRAELKGVEVCGKTGTAENSGKVHSWFVGFAPEDNPKVAVCVLLEESGKTGGEAAAPIAGEILKKALEIKEE